MKLIESHITAIVLQFVYIQR